MHNSCVRILTFVLTIGFSVVVHGQPKPEAYLFDQFQPRTTAQVIARGDEFKAKLHELVRSKSGAAAWIIYYNDNRRPTFDAHRAVTESLFGGCSDCFGLGNEALVTFLNQDGEEQRIEFWIVPHGADRPTPDLKFKSMAKYPPFWFSPINDPNKPDWEILPQAAKAGEVILSKRNKLGILSNFAATPFELDGKRYASVEGFWQSMLYPEGPDDERAKDKSVVWKFTREQVAQMTAFDAKAAGTLAEENMKKIGIDWCTYQGKRFPYRSATPGEHYKLILAAMRAKLEQNPEVKRILLATGDLKLRPDHIEEPNAPPEWHYYDIWMQLRSELQKKN
jgi:predicted NAD-dependent protein-ADP-ribosyltransferase YbiA (DUF1768 family)